ncbi:MAG: yjbJ [Gammaproteobacteria bacterium]|jgi:uncharacterized protein YjbJ (UPF0337 family)|nr:yjbJ [Gammaproteobacteria bacterium]
MMNQEQLQGNWQQLKGQFKKKWGKLTDDDLLESEGKREKLIGKMTERYGLKKEKAAKKLDKYLNRFDGTGNEMKTLANKVSDLAENMNVKAHDVIDNCQHYAKDHPLTVLGSAALAGAVLGLLGTRK